MKHLNLLNQKIVATSRWLKRVTILLALFLVSIGQMWGASPFTITAPSSSENTQEGIIISGETASRTMNGSGSQACFRLNNTSITIFSESTNITGLSFDYCLDGSSSASNAITIKTSTGAAALATPGSGFTATKDAASLASLTNIQAPSNTSQSSVSITFASPVKAIEIAKVANACVRNVSVTYNAPATYTTYYAATTTSTANTGSVTTNPGGAAITLLTTTTKKTLNTVDYYQVGSNTTAAVVIDLGSGHSFQAGDQIIAKVVGASNNTAVGFTYKKTSNLAYNVTLGNAASSAQIAYVVAANDGIATQQRCTLTTSNNKTYLSTIRVLRAADDCDEVDAPTSLSCTAQTQTSLTFGWTKASDASGYVAKLWDNSSCTGDAVATENIANGNTETVTFSDLTAGTTYYCKVQSKGDGSTYCAAGGTTDAASGTTSACTAISPTWSYPFSTVAVGITIYPTIGDNTGGGDVTYSSSATSYITNDCYAMAAGSATITTNVAAKGAYCSGSVTSGTITVVSDQSGLIKQTLTTGNSEWGTPSAPVTTDGTNITSTTVLSATNLTISGNGNTSNGNQTAKITGMTTGSESDNSSKYMQMGFTVKSGKQLNVSAIYIPVQPVSSDANNFKAVLSDGETTITGTLTNSPNGKLAYIKFDSYGTVKGNVTLTLYAWGWTGGYRLGKSIVIDGEIEDIPAAGPSVSSFTPASGATVKTGATVTIAGSTGSTVYYQWSSSSSAPEAATIVSDGTPGTADAGTVTTTGIASPDIYLYAVAVKDAVNSEVASASYTIDDTAPTLSSSDPANSATDVPTSGTIVLTFSENVTIADASKFSLSEGAGTLNTASASASGAAVTIPYSGLANSTTYTLSTAAGAVQDAAGNTSAVLSSISFTTSAAPIYSYKDATRYVSSAYKNPEGNAPANTTDETINLTTPWTICSACKTGVTSVVANGCQWDNKSGTEYKWITAYIKVPTGGDKDTKNITFTIASGYTATIAMKIGPWSGTPGITLKPLSGDALGDAISMKTGYDTIGGVAITEDNFKELRWDVEAGVYVLTVTTKNCYISQIDITTKASAPAHNMVAEPAAGDICSGATATIGLDGSTSGVNYQLYNGESTVGDPVAGTGSALTLTDTITTPGTYTVQSVANASYNATAMSGSVTISILTATAISTQPNEPIVVTLGDAAEIAITATGEGDLTYEWYTCNSDGTGASKITAAGDLSFSDYTTATLGLTPIAEGSTYYKCTVTGTCGSATTNVIEVQAAEQYDITHTLSNIIKVSGEAKATAGSNYTAVYRRTVGYTLPATVTVTRGETDITTLCTWTSSTGTLTIPSAQITGDITITVTGTAVECPDASNTETLFLYEPKTSLSDADISAGTYTFYDAAPGDYLQSVSGGFVTLYVPSAGDIRIRGNQLAFNSSNSYVKIELDCELQAKDRITVTSSGNAGDLWISLEDSKPSKETDATAVITQGTPYRIPAGSDLIGVSTIYFWRSSSTTQIGQVQIVRPETAYDITTSATNGTITTQVSGAAVVDAVKNAQVDISATGNTGYQFSSWSIYKTDDAGTTVTPNAATASTYFTMPQYDVTVSATFSLIDYTVTHSAATNGSYTIKVGDDSPVSTNTNANYGQTVTLGASPADGYAFSSWTVTGATSGDNIVVDGNNQFVMPAEAVTISASFAKLYTVSAGSHTNGSITLTPTTAVAGTTISIAATGDLSYVFSSWTIVDGESTNLTSTLLGANSTTASTSFTMPAYDVTVSAAFEVDNNDYTVSFSAGTGGGTVPDSESGKIGSSFTVPGVGSMTHASSYQFRGWLTSDDVFYPSEATYTIMGNETLTAVWDANDGVTTLVDIDFKSSTWSGKTFSQGNTTTSDVHNGVYFYSKSSDKQFSLSSNTSNGLTFPNNNLSSGNYYFCIPVTDINSSSKSVTIILKHGYSSAKASFKYVYVDGRDTYTAGNTNGSGGTTITDANNTDTQVSVNLSSLSKTYGHLMIGRNSSDYTKIYGVTVTTPGGTSYNTITFNNGSVTPASVSDMPTTIVGVPDDSKLYTPTNPSASGYTFGGWYKEAACTNAWDFATDEVDNDITLYAKWEPILLTAVSIDNLDLNVGFSGTPAVTKTPADALATAVWSIVDGDSYISIDSETGEVTATAPGTAHVKVVMTNSNSAEITSNNATVTVTYASLSSITISPAEVSMPEETSTTLTAVFNTGVDPSTAVTWTSSDSNVASVTSEGVVTAHKEGTATITCKATATPSIYGESEITVENVSSTGETVTFTLGPIGGEEASLETTSTASSVPAILINRSNIDYTRVGLASSPSKSNNRTAKLNTPEAKDATKYVELRFDVASGYTFNPTNVAVIVANVSDTTAFDFELADANYSVTASCLYSTSTTGDTRATVNMANADESKKMTGTVSLKIWPYGYSTNNTNTAEAFRFGNQIVITGNVQAAYADAIYEDGAWKYGRTPDENRRIQVNDDITISDVVTAKSVAIAEGQKITITSTGALVVAGKVTKENGDPTAKGDLRIGSGAAGNGTLIFDNDHNKATVEMYSKAYTNESTIWNWQYMGIPYVSAEPLYNYYNSYIYQWTIDATDASKDGWSPIYSRDVLLPWVGYCITNSTANTTYVMESGECELVATTDKELTIPAGENREVVFANPWTAPIHIPSIDPTDFGGSEATVYLFNTGLDSTKTGGAAGTETEEARYAAGTYLTLPVTAASTIGNPFISSMQGFIVKNTNAGGAATTLTLRYNTVVRPTGVRSVVGGPMHAPTLRGVNNAEPTVLKLMARGSHYDDCLYLLEREDFTRGFDNGWDGTKMGNSNVAPQITALNENGNRDAVSAVPDLDGTVVNFRAGEDSEYTIHFSYNGSDVLYLNDMLTETSTRIAEGGSYTFATSQSDEPNRFVISHTPFVKTTPTGMDNVQGDEGQSVRKLFYQGVMYIIRGGRIYNAEGARIQ